MYIYVYIYVYTYIYMYIYILYIYINKFLTFVWCPVVVTAIRSDLY